VSFSLDNMNTLLAPYDNIKIGSLIKLNDEVTIKESIAKKRGIKPVEYKVLERADIQAKGNIFTLISFKLEDIEKNIIYLVYKVVDSNHDVRVYNQMGWIQEGNRAKLLSDNHHFLFQNPGKDDFTPNELELAYSFSLQIDGKDVEYVEKQSDSVFGLTEHDPAQSGLDYPLFTHIKEYSTDVEVDTNEILYLEMGGVRRDGTDIPDGGWVQVLEGRNIDDTDYTVF
jgi:hypothetical protein